MKLLGTLISAGAIVGLSGPAPAATLMLHVRLCHGGTMDIPVERGGDGKQDRSCPAGCHAPLCQSRKRPGTPSV